MENELPEWRKAKNAVPNPSMTWLAKEARLANAWIYHKTTKKWYTPEEFEENAIQLYYEKRREANLHEFAIMDPIAGMRVRQQTLKKVTDELLNFQKRIDDYFNINLKNK